MISSFFLNGIKIGLIAAVLFISVLPIMAVAQCPTIAPSAPQTCTNTTTSCTGTPCNHCQSFTITLPAGCCSESLKITSNTGQCFVACSDKFTNADRTTCDPATMKVRSPKGIICGPTTIGLNICCTAPGGSFTIAGWSCPSCPDLIAVVP